ncbi:hypothetical protein M9458_055660 [Cirrhinus mrigala]|uniref:Murine leukemia virus integrase C-terminal domain-containing protein n=2 Tax=Cirrhinus mrigala TaxID=683832 RepID=A0ABD0MFL2_CIRMR
MAFESIKKELQKAPALSTPDYTKPFHLYVANRADGGNNIADSEAKKASGCQVAIMAPEVIIEPHPSLDDIIRIQQQAGPYEQSMWHQRGATKDSQNIWRSHEGHIVAPTSLLNILIIDAHGFDHCAKGEVVRKIKQQGYWSPYLYAMVSEFLSSCEICAKYNVRKGITAPIGHIPAPEGPFKHLVMDYVDMIKRVQGKRYMLVVVDRFSRWVEAVPSADEGAGTVWDPINNKPQAQSTAEKVNGILKSKINKICASTKLNWVDALPLALMSYRMQTNRITHLTPHEMLTGRPMPVPYSRGPYKGPPLEQLQMELRLYMKKLTAIHKAICVQEKKREPCEETETTSPVVPGDQVYLRVFRRKWHEPRREGPYKVTAATPTAIQVEGSNTWYHLNHCTRVPKPKVRESRHETTEQENQQVKDKEEQNGAKEIEQTNENNDSDNMSDHPMLVTTSNHNQHHYSKPHNSDSQPHFPFINFSTLYET